jgi:hypothetical protein
MERVPPEKRGASLNPQYQSFPLGKRGDRAHLRRAPRVHGLDGAGGTFHGKDACRKT